MKPTTLLLLPLLLAAQLVHAQAPRTAFYPRNWQLMNPAAFDRHYFSRSKSDPNALFSLGMRSDGLGPTGPKTYYLAVESPLGESPRWHWGASLLGDHTDAIASWEGSVMLRYKLSRYLDIGFQPRMYVYTVGRTGSAWAATSDPSTDATINQWERQAIWNFETNVGLFYRSQKYHAGFSIENLVAASGALVGWRNPYERLPQINLAYASFLEQYWDNLPLEVNAGLNYVLPTQQYYTLSNGGQPISANLNLRLHLNSPAMAKYATDEVKKNRFWCGIGLGTNGLGSVDLGWEHDTPKPTTKSATDQRLRLRIGITGYYPVWYPKVGFGPGIPSGMECNLNVPYYIGH